MLNYRMAHFNEAAQSLPFNSESDLPNACPDDAKGLRTSRSAKGGNSLPIRSTTDLLNDILEDNATLAHQNKSILSQVSRIASDVNYMSRDLAKITRIISKLEVSHERDQHAANVLHCEFQTFSKELMSTLKKLQGEPYHDRDQHKHWNVYFHGEHNVLSNFYYSPLRIDGCTFPTAEHAYQYRKAEAHDLTDTVGEQILDAYHAGGAKAAANRGIPHVSKEWQEMKRDVMVNITRAKAAQCRAFREGLLATGDRSIIHDLPSYEWGWGSSGDGSGKNLNGVILEEVRAELMNGLITIEDELLDDDSEVHRQYDLDETRPDYRGAQKQEMVEEQAAVSRDASPGRGRMRSDYYKINRGSAEVNKRSPMSQGQSPPNDIEWPDLPAPGTPSNESPVRTVTREVGGISVKLSNAQDKGGKAESLPWRKVGMEEDNAGDSTTQQARRGHRGMARLSRGRGSNKRHEKRSNWGDSYKQSKQNYSDSGDHESEDRRGSHTTEENDQSSSARHEGGSQYRKPFHERGDRYKGSRGRGSNKRNERSDWADDNDGYRHSSQNYDGSVDHASEHGRDSHTTEGIDQSSARYDGGSQYRKQYRERDRNKGGWNSPRSDSYYGRSEYSKGSSGRRGNRSDQGAKYDGQHDSRYRQGTNRHGENSTVSDNHGGQEPSMSHHMEGADRGPPTPQEFQAEPQMSQQAPPRSAPVTGATATDHMTMGESGNQSHMT